MLSIEVPVRVTGPAPAAQAWQRYEDIAEWKRWAPQITEVRADGDRLRVGLSGEVVGPLGVTAPFEVLEVDPVLMRWRWTVRFGPMRFCLEHAVSPLPHGCATTLRVRGFAPAVLAYAPLATVALSRLVH